MNRTAIQNLETKLSRFQMFLDLYAHCYNKKMKNYHTNTETINTRVPGIPMVTIFKSLIEWWPEQSKLKHSTFKTILLILI